MKDRIKKILILLCAIGLCIGLDVKVTAGSADNFSYYEDSDVVGFIGDSITHATYTSLNYVEIMYQYYLSRFPRRNVEFRNLSADGHRAEDALNTYERDPAFGGINKAVILLGTNNVILGYSPEDYIRDMEALVERLKADGLKGGDILILTPPICDENCSKNYDKNGRKRWTFESRLIEYIDRLEEKTAEWGVNYIDLHTPMAELTESIQKESSANTLTTDCIHPNTMGQFLIAYCILQAQGAGGEAATGISVPKEGEAQLILGELADYYRGEKGLYLAWKPETLPVAATDELLKFLQFYEPANALYRELFQVEGLSEDTRYRMLTEEAELGVFTGKELEEGVDLATLESCPLQATMRQLETLDRERHQNAAAYRKLWIEVAMQRADPTAEEVQKEYEKWKNADEVFRNEIQGMIQSMAGDTVCIYVIEEGYSLEELKQEARREAEERARREAEEARAAQEQVQREAEEQARKESEEQAQKELLIKRTLTCSIAAILTVLLFFAWMRKKRQ